MGDPLPGELRLLQAAVRRGLVTEADARFLGETLVSSAGQGAGLPRIEDLLGRQGRPDLADRVRRFRATCPDTLDAAPGDPPAPGSPPQPTRIAAPTDPPNVPATGIVGHREVDAPAAAPEVRMGKYRIERELGRGGMGVVYLAEDEELRRSVAVKTLRALDRCAPELAERLTREARTAGSLRHPGIVPILDYGISDGLPFFVMEFIRGKTLDEAVDRDGSPAERRWLEVLREAAEAVAHAHSRGIIHRDLKPSNIMIRDEGGVVVMDFGLARRLEGTQLTRTGQILGTPSFMAPEQIEGDAALLGPFTDVYALGSVLYWLLTGHLVFEETSNEAAVARALMSDVTPLRRLTSTVPLDLRTICRKALDRDRAMRYATAGEFAEDLGRYLRGEPIRARPEPRWRSWVRWTGKRKALVALSALVALALAVAGTSIAVQRHAEREQQRVQEEALAGLRAGTDLCLKAILTHRRKGGATRDLERDLLPGVEETVARTVAAAPRLAEPHFRMGRIHRALLRWAEAEAEQDRALEKEPGYLPARYERALLRARRYAAAVERLNHRWLQEFGRRGGGLEALRSESMPSEGDLVAADPATAALRDRLQADLAALQTSATGAPDAPAHTEAQRLCLEGLIRLTHGPEASDRAELRACFREVLRLDPTLEEAHEALARVTLELGDLAAARETYDAAVLADAGYVPHRIGRGRLHSALGALAQASGRDPAEEYARAEADLRAAVELDPLAGEAWLALGMLEHNRAARLQDLGGPEALDAFDSARRHFARALSIDGSNFEAETSAGILETSAGTFLHLRGKDPTECYRRAEQHLRRAVQGLPDAFAPRVFLADLLANRQRWEVDAGRDPSALEEEGVRLAEEAIRLNPAAPEAWACRARFFRFIGLAEGTRGTDPRPRYGAALRDLTQAIRLAPDCAESWAERGETAVCLANEEERRGVSAWETYRSALSDFDRALALHPGRVEVLISRGNLSANLAAARINRGQDPAEFYRRACEDYGRALEAAPASTEVRHLRGRVHESWGRWRLSIGADPSPAFEASLADFDHATMTGVDGPSPLLDRAGVCALWATWKQEHDQDPSALLARAEEDIAAVLAARPESVPAWLARADLYGRQARILRARGSDPEPGFAAAEQAFARALALDPTSRDARRGRGMLRINRGNERERRGHDPAPHYVGALEDLDAVLSGAAPVADDWMKRGTLHANWGFALERTGRDATDRFLAALADYDRAVGERPTLVEARWRRGWIHYALRRWQDAISDFEAAEGMSPSSAGAFRAALDDARRRGAGGAAEVAAAWGGLSAQGSKALQTGRLEDAVAAYGRILSSYDDLKETGSGDAGGIDRDPGLRATLATAAYKLACAHARQAAVAAAGGEPDRADARRGAAFVALDRALRFGFDDRAHLDADPDLAALHADPRWEALLRR